MTTPTQRSLAHLRGLGYLPEVVEKWNAFSRTRKDLYGFGDILAIRGRETLIVQTTSYSNVPSRVRKIGESELVGAVREAGWRIEVHGWRVKDRKAECRVIDLS